MFVKYLMFFNTNFGKNKNINIYIFGFFYYIRIGVLNLYIILYCINILPINHKTYKYCIILQFFNICQKPHCYYYL